MSKIYAVYYGWWNGSQRGPKTPGVNGKIFIKEKPTVEDLKELAGKVWKIDNVKIGTYGEEDYCYVMGGCFAYMVEGVSLEASYDGSYSLKENLMLAVEEIDLNRLDKIDPKDFDSLIDLSNHRNKEVSIEGIEEEVKISNVERRERIRHTDSWNPIVNSFKR